jgi:hydrogenase maturation protease
VEVRDYGTRSIDLAYALLLPWRAVILVDAITRGGSPGSLYLLQPDETASSHAEMTISPHSMDPASVLRIARSLGEISAEIYIIGCEPANLSADDGGYMGLSPEVAAAIPEAENMIQELTTKLTNVAANSTASIEEN